MDGATNKPREIDLIAEKHSIRQGGFGRNEGALIIKLFIECKYTPQSTVFWFSGKDIELATEWVTSNTPLTKRDTQKHHYLTSRKVAKLFGAKTARR